MTALTVLISAVVLIALASALPSIKQALSPAKLPADIDLSSVRNAMMEKHGWSFDRTDAAETEYRRFLTLLQMKLGFMLIPWQDPEGRDDLDQFWHQHILDTAKYAEDCDKLFGRMIHHNPHVVKGSELDQESVDKTRRLYARTFKSGAYGSSVDLFLFSSCSSCGASSHSADGAHSGDGGHGGGHGCGGHGCGGHGCGGGGCGGH